MRIKSEKDEQREIRRLKEILFPKNKQVYKEALNALSSNDLCQSQTRRQPAINPKSHKLPDQIPRPRPQNTNNKKKRKQVNGFGMLYDNHAGDQINELEYYAVGELYPSEQQHQVVIKQQISKLKQQISTMLKKWGDNHNDNNNEYQQQQYDRPLNQYQQKARSQLPTYQAISQQLSQPSDREAYTRRYYLSNINKLSQHLQKYNSYMYGIKEAAQQVISSIPVDRNQQTFMNPHLRAYKLYYLGMMLVYYFVDKVQQFKIKKLRAAFNHIRKSSENEKENKEDQRRKKNINKGKFMFLRKNLIDKAFQKWRLNSHLIKFYSTLNPPIQPSLTQEVPQTNSLHESAISQFYGKQKICVNHQNKSGQLLGSQFFLKNILQKQKVVQFLREYLLNSIKVSTSQYNDKQAQNHINHDVQIVLFDSQNNEMFSFIDQSNYLYQEMQGKIVESRLYNILDTIRADSSYNEQNTQSSSQKKCFKKYSFQLKNSLTRMCIDCQKTIRISQMKRNQVYSLEVDSSINEQIWIKTSKTQRSSRVQEIVNKNPLTIAENTKPLYIAQQVFYQQKFMLDNQFSYFQNPNTKVSAIFYPIIHEDSLIGLVRQYVYHSVPIPLQNYQLPYGDLQFVTKSIFTAFELSYSFEGLRKEYDIVERKYALRVLRIVKKMKDEIQVFTSGKQPQGKSQEDLTNKIMQIFTDEMSRLLHFQGKKRHMTKQEQTQSEKGMGLLVYKLRKEQDQGNNRSKKERILLCIQRNQERKVFDKVFGSIQVNESEMEGILNEFYNESKHKESNISIVKHSLNQQQLTKQANKINYMNLGQSLSSKTQKILLIKSRSSIHSQGLYSMFVFDSVDDNKFMQSLPPLQLLVDIMSKFSQIYHNGLKELGQSKLRKEISYSNQIINSKHKLNQRMNEFYLESLKLHIYQGEANKIKKQKVLPYTALVSAFVKKCMKKFIDEIKSLNLPTTLSQTNRITTEIVYLAQMNLNSKPNIRYEKQFQEGKQLQEEKLYLVVTEQQFQSFSNQQILSQYDDKSLEQKCQLHNQEEYSQWIKTININQEDHLQSQNSQSFTQEKQGQTDLKFKVINVRVKVQSAERHIQQCLQEPLLSNENASSQSLSLKLTNQQTSKMLQQIVQSFISFTFNQLVQNQSMKIVKSNQNIYNKQAKPIKSNTQQLQQIKQPQKVTKSHKLKDQVPKQIDNYIENIREKVFEIYCKSKKERDQHSQSTEIDNKEVKIDSKLTNLADILHRIATSLCHKYSFQPQSLDIQVNKDNLKLIIDQIAYKTSINTTTSIKIKTQNHKLISQDFLSTYQSLFKLIDYPLPIENKDKQQTAQQDKFSLLYQLIDKSKKLMSQFNLLIHKNLINSNPQTQSEINGLSKCTIRLPIKTLNQVIKSSYFVVNASSQPDNHFIIIKINQAPSSLNPSPNIQPIHSQLSSSLSTLIQFAINEYISLFNWKQGINRKNNFLEAFAILIHGKTIQNSSNQQQSLDQNQNQNQCHKLILNSQGLIMENLSVAFNQIRKHSSYLVFKGNKLLKISQFISKNTKHSALKHILKWQSIKNDIKHSQLMRIIKNKIISNPEKQSDKIQCFIDAIGKNLLYSKILWPSLTKINFFAKHNRIADFSSFRLKCLQNAVEALNRAQSRFNNKQMKRFMANSMEIGQQKRREQFFRGQNIKLFVIQLQNCSLYKRKVTNSIKKAFNSIKKITIATPSVNNALAIDQRQDKLTPERPLSVDELITQSKSIQQVSQVLSKEFSNYDIWVRPIKKSHHYILISSPLIEPARQTIQVSARNLSFDESSIMGSRINSITNRSKPTSKLTKQDVYLTYSPDDHSFLQTSQAIFVSRNSSLNLQDLLSSGPLILDKTIHSSNTSANSFKQKDKLHSLAKSLTQFFSNFKIQFNIKITYFDAIFEAMKLKRFSFSLKKWRKYNDNLRLLTTCELTDKIYQLNVQSQSVKDKLKIQQKEIHDQKSQYNRLLKKQIQHKNRIEKYSTNIQILGKMLQHYQMAIKQEQQQIMRSAVKSSKKFNKNKYIEPLVDLNSLDQEQRNLIAITLTKWRQVNQSDRIKEFRLRNLQKQTKFMVSCISRSWKIMSRTVKLSAFQRILSYSIYAQQLRQHKLRQQRLRVQRLQREEQERIEKQRIEKESYERKRKQIEQLQKEIGQRKLKQATKNNWKYETQHLSGSKNVTPNKSNISSKIQEIKDVSGISQCGNEDSQISYYNDYSMESVEKRSISHSLAEQLEGEFNELNRRLVTFQKNNASPQSQSQEVTYDNCFDSFESSQLDKPQSCTELDLSQKALQSYKAPNNTVDLAALVNEKISYEAKMTQEEKIRFELEKMKMRKPEFNKENLTVTKEEYEKVNGNGASYKLGGKTLRFLKRMGKLEAGEKNEKA